jgi:hypothetical protein
MYTIGHELRVPSRPMEARNSLRYHKGMVEGETVNMGMGETQLD